MRVILSLIACVALQSACGTADRAALGDTAPLADTGDDTVDGGDVSDSPADANVDGHAFDTTEPGPDVADATEREDTSEPGDVKDVDVTDVSLPPLDEDPLPDTPPPAGTGLAVSVTRVALSASAPAPRRFHLRFEVASPDAGLAEPLRWRVGAKAALYAIPRDPLRAGGPARTCERHRLGASSRGGRRGRSPRRMAPRRESRELRDGRDR